MSEELVLITGITGFIGFRVLLVALDYGYRVRGVVRKQAGVELVKQAIAGHQHAANIEFVIIPDLAAPKAFDRAMEDVSYTIHVASPLEAPSDDYERDYFQPAVEMTLNVLSIAAVSPQVKRVVITSSIATQVVASEFLQGRTGREVFRADDAIEKYERKGQFPASIVAYAASKVFALETAENFMKTTKPHFDLVTIMPSFVLGPDTLATTAEEYKTNSTNKAILGLLLEGVPGPFLGSTVSVIDVAELHVRAVDLSIPAGRYYASSDGERGSYWGEAFDFVKKYFPDASEKTFVQKIEPFVVHANVDTVKTQQAFSFEFRSFEEQVRSVVENYLELLAKEM